MYCRYMAKDDDKTTGAHDGKGNMQTTIAR
jgi:hypothetical protein